MIDPNTEPFISLAEFSLALLFGSKLWSRTAPRIQTKRKDEPRTSFSGTAYNRTAPTAAQPGSGCARLGDVSRTSPAMAVGRGWRPIDG